MRSIKTHLLLAFGLSVLVFTFASTASAQLCKQWDMSGVWTISQANSILVTFDLRQNGDDFTGYASFPGRKRKESGTVKGHVDVLAKSGWKLEGSNISLEVKWDYGETGIYRGQVTRDGGMSGHAWIKEDFNNAKRQTYWHSDANRPCKVRF